MSDELPKGWVTSYAEASSSRLATAADLLVVWDGARNGWVGAGREGAIGSTIMALRPEVGDRTYLLRWLQSHFRTINTNTRGTGIPHVDPEVFWNLHVPLPPIAEQRRIVARLEKLLAKVDACQQRLAKIPALLKRFRQAVLAAACAGRLSADWRVSNLFSADSAPLREEEISRRAAESAEESLALPTDWRTARLGDCVESSFYGPRFAKERYASEGIPTVRTTDMSFAGSIVLTNAPRIRLPEEELEKYRLRHGDLVVTRTGATIGKCAVYDRSQGPAIPGAHLIRFRFKQSLASPRYVLLFLMSPLGQSLLIGGSNAVAQPNVNAATISQFLFPLPPLPKQHEIVRRVEALFALADRIEARFEQARQRVGKLPQAILARAFRGELVPQDPDDEPASVLLERVARERGTHAAKSVRQKESRP